MRWEGGPAARQVVAACISAALAACWGDLGGDGAATRRAPLDVPASWQTARGAPGHIIHVGQQKLACERCHAVASGQLDDPGPLPCAPCHLEQAGIRHASEQAQARFGDTAQADCTDCHAFAAAPPGVDAASDGAAWDCSRCHDGHDPEGPGAVAVHRGATCAGCHTPHGEARATAGDCQSCHAGLQVTHGRAERAAPTAAVSLASSAPTTARCQVCHQRLHEPAAASLAGCVECHAATPPLVTAQALFAGGHERCTSCHAPHGFEKDAALACASCHRDQPPALASARVPAHARCESCHAPHDARADAGQACGSCHRQLDSDHPAPPAGSACTGCHVAHPAPSTGGALHASNARLPCSQCHEQASGDGGWHASGVACRECHVPHRFQRAAADMAPCERCHAPELERTRTLGAGHGACQQCHAGLPHHPAGEPRACGSCHAPQSRSASPGHRACQGCHEPHAGTQQAPCASCHAEQHATAPEGHRACLGCHEPHTGALAVAGCTACHGATERAPHHQVDGGCAACHGAHGPATKPMPACASCHQRSGSRDLHAVEQHGRCQDCHRAHGAAAPREAQACRSCHRDRAEHFPDAQRCSGCHLFTPL